jgi:hypothetical protein
MAGGHGSGAGLCCDWTGELVARMRLAQSTMLLFSSNHYFERGGRAQGRIVIASFTLAKPSTHAG